MKKIIVILFVIVMLGFSLNVNAVNNKQAMPENLRMQLIALIIEQIKILQAQLNEMIAQQSLMAKQIQQNTQQISQNACVSNWQCSNWAECSNSIQTRVCNDINTCSTTSGKPTESQYCVPNDLAKIQITNISNPKTQIHTLNDVYLWRTIWNVSNNDVLLNSIRFRQVGSVSSATVQNFRLYVDSVQVASTQSSTNLNGGQYVEFNSSVKLTTGSKMIELVGDVGDEKDRSFSFWFHPTDVQLIDTKYNKEIKITETIVSNQIEIK